MKPFSHVIPSIFDKYAPKDGDSIREKIHEKVTVDIASQLQFESGNSQ